MAACAGRPDPKQIKKRIEDLIAREYLERDSNNANRNMGMRRDSGRNANI